jgi:hypothetical protein
MFTLIDGGFNLFIEEVINVDLSWLTMFISMVILNVLLTIRRFNIWSNGVKKAKEQKVAKRDKK